jgi:hypothetical protein
MAANPNYFRQLVTLLTIFCRSLAFAWVEELPDRMHCIPDQILLDTFVSLHEQAVEIEFGFSKNTLKKIDKVKKHEKRQQKQLRHFGRFSNCERMQG